MMTPGRVHRQARRHIQTRLTATFQKPFALIFACHPAAPPAFAPGPQQFLPLPGFEHGQDGGQNKQCHLSQGQNTVFGHQDLILGFIRGGSARAYYVFQKLCVDWPEKEVTQHHAAQSNYPFQDDPLMAEKTAIRAYGIGKTSKGGAEEAYIA